MCYTVDSVNGRLAQAWCVVCFGFIRNGEGLPFCIKHFINPGHFLHENNFGGSRSGVNETNIGMDENLTFDCH